MIRENIIPKMFFAEVPANQYVFKQGDNASSFFIVESGSFEVIVNDKSVRNLKYSRFRQLCVAYQAEQGASHTLSKILYGKPTQTREYVQSISQGAQWMEEGREGG